MTETLETPMCPRCKVRPRAVWASGLVGSYCAPCSSEDDRERKGWSPAERTCEICEKPYRGNRRAKAQVCPDCRNICVTCREPKNPKDSHTECFKCRKVDKVCITCEKNPPLGNRRQCWNCLAEEGAETAKHRDRLYGLAPGQFDQMMAEQGGVCHISGLPETSVSKKTGKTYPLAVDHDRACCPGNRSCGKCVRGLIRRNINVLLGMANDDPALLRACADYIERFRTQVNTHAQI